MGYAQIVLAAFAVTMLSGCGVPRGAALQREILAPDPAGFSVYPVTQDQLPIYAAWDQTQFQALRWISQGPSGPQKIKPGDHLDVIIWDAEPNSLLTSATEKQTRLENITVTSEGQIFIPYLDHITVSGLTIDAARLHVQSKMLQIIPSAQVQLSLSPGARQSIDIVAGVARPGTYPLADPDGQNTVLGMIAVAGGVTEGLRNPHVSLTRAGQNYDIALNRLYDGPTLNIGVRGRDRIIITPDPRFFRALGAAQEEQIVPFDRDRITALDALAMVGGLQDNSADPKGILILRNYDSAVLHNGGPKHERTIFTIDLTSADGLFSAGKFDIRPHDTVMVTEAPIAPASTVISLFANAIGAITRAGNL